MTTAKLFLTVIACAALLRGICHADPAGSGNQNAPTIAGHNVWSAGEKAQAPQPAQKLDRPLNASQIHGGVVKNPPANTSSLGQPFSAPARLPVKPTPNSVHSLNIRPSVIQPAGPLLTKAPDHGSTRAVVGGPATQKIKTAATAAVTGTGLNRKP